MKCLITEKINAKGIDLFRKNKIEVDLAYDKSIDEIKEIIKDYDALIVGSDTSVDKEMIDKAEKLKCIAMAGIGLNHVDTAYAKTKDIEVYNVPDGSTQSVAELALAFILLSLRDIYRCTSDVKRGIWDKPGYPGNTLDKKTVGICALGRIGRRVAELCQAFGAKVIAYDPYLPQEVADSLDVELMDLDDLIKESDIISIHSPLTEETYHMIDEEKMKLMKEGVVLLNLGRGGLVDEEALYNYLKSGHIAAAAFDVLEQEPPREEDKKLLNLDQFILTCHIGAGAEEAQEYIATRVAEQIIENLNAKVYA